MNPKLLTPTKALNIFSDCKKNEQEVPKEVLDVIKTYRKWNEFELVSLKNLSAYYPDIFLEDDMEDNIEQLLVIIKKREIDIPIY